MAEASNPAPTQLQDLPDMLTANDLASILQTTTRTIRRLVIRGVLPTPQRFGRLMRWSRQGIGEILTGQASRN
jgi:predicted DNA-binding transcriptional regulator AlpA